MKDGVWRDGMGDGILVMELEWEGSMGGAVGFEGSCRGRTQLGRRWGWRKCGGGG